MSKTAWLLPLLLAACSESGMTSVQAAGDRPVPAALLPAGCSAFLRPPLGAPAPESLRADGPWQRCGAYGVVAARRVKASLDGSRVALVTDSGEAWVLDSPGLTLVDVFAHGEGRIGYAALSPDGARLATFDDTGGAVALWDVATHALVHVWHRPPSQPAFYTLGDVSFSHDGTRLAVIGLDRLDVFDVQGGDALPISGAPGGMRVEFVAGDTRLAVSRFSVWGNGPYAGWGAVDLMDADTGYASLRLDANLYIELAEIFASRDGTVLGVGNTVDGILFYDTGTGARQATAHLDGALVGLSIDGTRAAVLSTEGGVQTLTVRRAQDGVAEAVLALAQTRTSAPVITTPDLGHLLVGDTAPAVLTALSLPLGGPEGHACGEGRNGGVSGLALSPDGATLVGTGSEPHVWDVATGAELATPPASSFGPSARSEDGTLFAEPSNSTAGYFVVRRVADGAVVRVFGPHPTRVSTLEWSPDGDRIASGSERDPADRRTNGAIKVWSMATGQLEQDVGWNAGPVALFHPDARRLFVGGEAANVYCR